MSTSAPVSADELQALEEKVLRAVEIVKRERDARAAAEAEIARLHQQIAERQAQLEQHQAEIAAQRQQFVAELEQQTSTHKALLSDLQQERLDVRNRVEKMLQQMDDLL